MSGIEAAGLALAVLPLILSTAKGYDNVLGPFLRYKRFAKEAKTYSKELDIQRTIFRNECRNLLEEIIEHDAASSMFQLLTKETWSDSRLNERLLDQLGESKQACVKIIELIEERLRDIDDENNEFCTIVEQECRAIPRSFRNKAWRHGVGEKLRFSFSKSRLEQHVAALRTHNKDLRVLFSQTRRRATSGTSLRTKVYRDSCNDVRKYQTIRKASQQVYEALGKACNKHTEHVASFRVEVERFASDGQNAPQVKFSMAFTHMTLAGSTGSGDPIWFLVESSLGDERSKPADDKGSNLDELGKTLKRQFDGAGSQTPRKVKKCVRFQSPVPEFVPSFPIQIASDAFTSKNCLKRDFCDDLRRCFREPRKANVCVGVLENTDKCKHFVYPSPMTPCSQSCNATSLGQLIRSASRPGLVGGIPVHERLGLAKNLAIAVLQYHSTPWLRQSWRSDDILFFSANKITQLRDIPSLSAPHLNAKVKEPDRQPSCASSTPQRTIARNQVLFSLGVVLLEIAYAASLESLKQDSDLTNGLEDRYTEFFTARRLARSKHSIMGITYHNIVEQLVECVFPCGDDLKNDQLQAAFHNDIICPLTELEEGFRKLHLAS